MNRRILNTGLGILILGIGLLVFPLVTTGVEQIDLELQLGVFILPVGAAILLVGASAPDPEVTTVGGVFGSREENFLRRHIIRRAPFVPPRLLPHPRESMNCDFCYTAIAADAVVCPRCGRTRACRVCAGVLRPARGTPRCTSCRRAEVYCDCPKVKRSQPVGGLRHGLAY